ncbi:MAG TPA: adenylate/guanylate cyclase domain-containing protein [Haliscomenobacter sp.]|uniref:adenylate/guanylate cyclase domain-containing protein n=1 Tax=Haliscomenobacter sp. TaxID=2717303 RepID=UPI002B8DD426|nr:adenylate/guanylate cyclase domain-containing protein [Haliscomenobacter sp.]HOY16517.1 adenylate/guanylate cyclase domain-containing protein [Haliscomenobacter sp.]HPH19642.1 adenylate/guanylate cyclase domain-containing protein [Haliscomenobacter sp.]
MMTRNQLVQLAVISMIWVTAGLLTALYEYFFLANYPGVLETAPMQEFDLGKNAVAAMGGLFVGSLLFGLLELFYFQKKIIREKFWVVMLKKIAVYVVLLFILLVGISYAFNSILSGRSIGDPLAWQETRNFIGSIAFWHPVSPILLLVLLSSFWLQLSERFGSNELWMMFSGRYFNPKEEQRIFMFLDLNHSTTIAEKLGNEKFYRFLNDFFHDIAAVITLHKGEVVEYIGDLVIISWTFPSGSFETRCLTCYKDFEKVIETNKGNYLSRYGVIPQFKAAVHCGKVIIGEMGRIKKSIKFSGDVLNTTSRVEKECGALGAKLVITDKLVDILSNPPYSLEKVSNISLKGKEKPMDLYKVGV